MELLHQPGEIIAQRYRILNTLGQGGVGITYKAQDLQNSQQVALKALSLRRMTDWKVLELFEREAQILSELNHPAIPHYLNYFQVDTAENRSFYIAQQLAPGKSLAALVESGWKPNEAQVKHLAIQILQILVYLHSLTPAVIHRDIKPQNIILQKNGQVFLVDFGAVQDTYHNTVTGGSTVVGTYGYMAPEQFRGQAVLSTDLYGLGTTLLFLLTGKCPADLPQRKLKINFRSHVSVSKEFADWLEKMLEPVIEERFSSAKEALAVLRGEQAITVSRQKLAPPKNTPIALTRLTKTEKILWVEIPSVWLRSTHSLLFSSLPLVGYGFFWLVLFWICTELFTGCGAGNRTDGIYLGFLFLGGLGLSIFLLIGLCIIGWLLLRLVGLWMPGGFLFRGLFHTSMEIDRENFQLNFSLKLFLLNVRWKIQGLTKNIEQLKLSSINLPLSKKSFSFCVIRQKRRKHRFGLFLTQQENEWLVGEISSLLEEIRS